MCDTCDGLPRRTFLKTTAALGAAALLAACQTQPVQNLPDVLDDPLSEGTGGVKIDPSKIKVPPPQPPQVTEYGDIMARSAWTSVPLRLANGTPMDGVTRITIHHSGDGKAFLGTSVADVARHLQIVQQAHLQRGMIDIAYHFAVDRTGRVWQLRWLEYEGQHVRRSPNGKPNNPHNIGVVVLGDFDRQAATVNQRDRLCNLVRLLRGKYSLAPRTVFMHGEIVGTDCPGARLRPVILDARKRGML
jgi:hypothetical protein